MARFFVIIASMPTLPSPSICTSFKNFFISTLTTEHNNLQSNLRYSRAIYYYCCCCYYYYKFHVKPIIHMRYRSRNSINRYFLAIVIVIIIIGIFTFIAKILQYMYRNWPIILAFNKNCIVSDSVTMGHYKG